MSTENPVTVTEESHVRVRIERTASGKLVKMLTADQDASASEGVATVDRVVDLFAYLENRAARTIEGSDIPPMPAPADPDAPFSPIPDDPDPISY